MLCIDDCDNTIQSCLGLQCKRRMCRIWVLLWSARPLKWPCPVLHTCRYSSTKNVWATGAGSARPVVSMMIASRGSLRCSNLYRILIKSPRTVQQMQPLFISITSSYSSFQHWEIYVDLQQNDCVLNWHYILWQDGWYTQISIENLPGFGAPVHRPHQPRQTAKTNYDQMSTTWA